MDTSYVTPSGFDALGDRLKLFEATESMRKLPSWLPVYARIDGRAFSNFTRPMARPYDERLSSVMVETTKYLVEKTGAVLGYTQSDEISLAWWAEMPQALAIQKPRRRGKKAVAWEGERCTTELLFGGRVQKLTSILAAMATARFLQLGLTAFPEAVERQLPMFDCRIFSLPTAQDCADAFLWREQDARKNAVSMAARAHFSHRQIDGKNSAEMKAMLASKGIDFDAYPAFFRRGTYVRRIVENRFLTPEELARIPVANRPDSPVERSRIVEVDLPPMSRITNRTDVVFASAAPAVA
jgi:tRNA(His) 5'-end guanylyltransferase